MRMIKNLMFGVMLVPTACTTTNVTDPSAGAGVALRVAFWDRTENGMTQQPRVELSGSGDSWLPAMDRRFNKHTFSGLNLGTTQTFVFDPFGNDQFKIPVDVPITEALCPSGCIPDTLNFEIRDEQVAVWGVVESHLIDRPDS